MTVELYEGQETLEVVGEAKYQDNLWRIVGDRRAPNGRVREDIVALLRTWTSARTPSEGS